MGDDTQMNGVIVAIPAYHEERRIGDVVRRCLKFGAEVWVMDDGSTDRTGEEAEKAGARVIRHSRNLGKGMAIRSAMDLFRHSNHRRLIFMDADGQHDPVFIPKLAAYADDSGADLVIGNRMLSTAHMPWVRRWTNQFMSWAVSRLAGSRIPDSQCGYRLLSRRFVERFRPTTCRFDLESEMLIQAGRLGLKIGSLPISTIYEGQSSHIQPFWDTLRFIRLVARYW